MNIGTTETSFLLLLYDYYGTICVIVMQHRKITGVDFIIMAAMIVFTIAVICLPAEPYLSTDRNGLFLSTDTDSYYYARLALEYAGMKIRDFPIFQKKVLMPAIAAIIIKATGINAHVVLSHLAAVILSLSVIPAYLFVTKRSTRFGGIAAGLSAALAPSFVEYACPGVFDTNALLALLPLCLITSLIECYEADTKKVRILYAVSSAVSLALISLAWSSWYIYALCAAGVMITAVFINRSAAKALPLIAAAILILLVSGRFTGIEKNIAKFGMYLNRSFSALPGWPNPFETVAELRQLPFRLLVIYGGGLYYFICTLLGIIIMIADRKKIGKLTAFSLPIWFACGAVFAIIAMRFTELAVLPASLITGFLAGLVPEKICEIFDLEEGRRRKILITMFTLILCISIVTGPVLYSYQKVMEGRNDRLIPEKLSDACMFLREETPGDAIIVSWWDLGYYYQYAAGRQTVADGGNHDGYINVMLARGLMNADSDAAKGCFDELIGNNSGRDRYLLITKDMLNKSDAISYFANWDRNRAADDLPRDDLLMYRLFTEEKDSQGVFDLKYSNDYVKVYSF